MEIGMRCLHCDFDPDDDPLSTPITATDTRDYVLAADTYRTNADLIVACHRLNYIKDTDTVLDPTYGNGGWWTKYEPMNLHKRGGDGQPWDFTDMPTDWSNAFDVVTFDPPYVSPGGRSTTTIPDFFSRYGMDTSRPSPLGVQTVINAGIQQCCRVAKPNGYVFIKCMDYISSGKLWNGTFRTLHHALTWGELEDIFYMVRGGSPQSQQSQVHARRNVSTLFILKVKK